MTEFMEKVVKHFEKALSEWLIESRDHYDRSRMVIILGGFEFDIITQELQKELATSRKIIDEFYYMGILVVKSEILKQGKFVKINKEIWQVIQRFPSHDRWVLFQFAFPRKNSFRHRKRR